MKSHKSLNWIYNQASSIMARGSLQKQLKTGPSSSRSPKGKARIVNERRIDDTWLWPAAKPKKTGNIRIVIQFMNDPWSSEKNSTFYTFIVGSWIMYDQSVSQITTNVQKLPSQVLSSYVDVFLGMFVFPLNKKTTSKSQIRISSATKSGSPGLQLQPRLSRARKAASGCQCWGLVHAKGGWNH